MAALGGTVRGLDGRWLGYAYEHRDEPLTVEHIKRLGALIEPQLNAKGFRPVPTRAGRSVMIAWQKVEHVLETLVKVQPGPLAARDDAQEWFRQYEDCHPFLDGNGRTGSLLRLHLLGRLADPIHAPTATVGSSLFK